MDANFGLVRKRNSGQSVHSPAQDVFFIGQEDAETFVAAYCTDRTKDKVGDNYVFINIFMMSVCIYDVSMYYCDAAINH